MEQPMFTSYVSFCEAFRKSIESNLIYSRDKSIIVDLCNDLMKMYGFTYKEAGQYIADYFMDKKYMEFEKLVRLDRACFPTSRQ
jgi:hypothetical protein